MKRITILLALVLFGCGASTTNVPEMPSWSGEQYAYEPAGTDGIHCWKVSLSEEEWRDTAASLKLMAMDTYPEYDTSLANCKVSWWDVDFPKQAQSYWTSSEGDIRRLALYKDDILYITNEIR